MKTLNQIKELMSDFEKKSGIPLGDIQQGSEAWLTAKLGVLSASNASKIVAKKDSETRNTYMMELIAQVVTGSFEEINSKYMDWGRIHEGAARSSYEFENDLTVQEIAFVFKDEKFRAGVSVDGLVELSGKLIPVEYKCPYNTVNYLKFLLQDKIKPEYQWQCQFGMWVLGAELYHMAQFDPRMKVMPFKKFDVEKDETMQKTLNDAVPQFINDMDKILDNLGVKFGDQWKGKQ